MTQVISRESEGTVKVSRKVVALVSELSDARAEAQAIEARVQSLREQILSEVGENARVLIHNNLEVARINKQVTPRPDSKLLREKFPEVWEAVARDTIAFVIRSVTRQAN